jgi:hypothetical protein
MLDDFESTQELLAAMRACPPFKVRLTPPLLAQLRARPESAGVAERQMVREISYLVLAKTRSDTGWMLSG